MTDQQIEQEIQAKDADVAPRITPADIEASIASEVFFTAYQGASMATSGPIPGELGMVTICAIVLRNGHRIIGVNEGPVSPDIFSAEIGRQYAREHAIDQIWPLLGYELRSKLAAEKEPAPGLQPIDTAPTDGAVFLGYRERDGRWGECYRVQRDDCEMWSFGVGSAAAEEFPDFKPTHWMPLPANPSA